MKKLKRNLILYFFVCLLMVIVFLPLYWMISSSFKTEGEIVTTKPQLFPVNPTLENYQSMLFGGYRKYLDFPAFVVNSLMVSGGTALLCLLLAFFAGYSIARFKIRGMKIVAPLLLLTYTFPTTVLMVPEFELISMIKLYDNLLGLTLIYVTITAPFGAWLLSRFFEAIPKEMEEAARLDGARKRTILSRIILPLSGPGLLTVLAYSFITAWSDYVFAFILTTSQDKKTVPLGVSGLFAAQGIYWAPLLVGGVLAILPVVLLFLPLSKFFLKGLAFAGATKG